MVCADAGVEVTKDNQLVRLRHSRQEGVQVLVELVFGGVGAGHRRGVGADDGCEFASPLVRQTEAHQTIVDALRQTGQSSHDVIPDGEGDTRVTSLGPGATTPEEGVAGTHLLQLAFFGESGLAECGDVHLVTRQFSGHQRRPPFRSAARVSPLTLADGNVHSLSDNPRRNQPERRTVLVARELMRYKLDIAGLNEILLSEQGQLEEVDAGYIFF
ncbi:hypothetical protein SprV_0301300100 [Sparganum proliferum]